MQLTIASEGSFQTLEEGQHRDVVDRRRSESSDEHPGPGEAAEGGTLRRELRPRGPVRFEIAVIEGPDAVRLRIRGELDILTTPKLSSELNTLMRRSDGDVIVDLRDAVFIDSAGLQILLGTQRRLGRASRKLTVVCDAGPVRRVIEMTRLDNALGLTWGEGA